MTVPALDQSVLEPASDLPAPEGEPGEETAKEMNFKALTADRDGWRARALELEPVAAEYALWKTGFDPESGEGKILLRDVAEEKVGATPEEIVAHAEAEYGWKAPIRLSVHEQAQVDAAKRRDSLDRVSASDYEAGSPEARIEGQIAKARDEGDWTLVSQLDRMLTEMRTRRS